MSYDIEILADRDERERELMEALNRPESVQRVIDELAKPFSVLNICDVWDWMEWSLGVRLEDLDWAGECNHILTFCNNFRLYLYEVPGDKFYEWEGIEKGKGMGYSGVVLSSLS